MDVTTINGWDLLAGVSLLGLIAATAVAAVVNRRARECEVERRGRDFDFTLAEDLRDERNARVRENPMAARHRAKGGL